MNGTKLIILHGIGKTAGKGYWEVLTNPLPPSLNYPSGLPGSYMWVHPGWSKHGYSRFAYSMPGPLTDEYQLNQVPVQQQEQQQNVPMQNPVVAIDNTAVQTSLFSNPIVLIGAAILIIFLLK